MKTILVADKDNRVKNVIRLLFTEDRGYRVVSVSSGMDAILRAKEIEPDIVLVNVSLPDKDGYQVTKEIKSDLLLRKAILVLLNPEFAAFNKEKALESYADDIIIKPFGTEIIEKIESLLNQRENKGIEFTSVPQTGETFKEKRISELVVFYRKLVEREKSLNLKSLEVIVQTVAENLKGHYQLAKGLKGSFKVPTKNLKGIETLYRTLTTRYLKIPFEEFSLKKRTAGLITFHKKLMEQTKPINPKSFEVVIRAIANDLKDCYRLVRELTKNVKMPTTINLKHTKIVPRIPTVRPLGISLPPVSVRKHSLIALSCLIIALPLTILVASNDRREEIAFGVKKEENKGESIVLLNTTSNTTPMSIFGLTRPELGSGLEPPSSEGKGIEERFGDKGDYINKEALEAVVTKDRKTSGLKQRAGRKSKRKIYKKEISQWELAKGETGVQESNKWKIRKESQKRELSRYKELSKKDLEEVLRETFLLH